MNDAVNRFLDTMANGPQDVGSEFLGQPDFMDGFTSAGLAPPFTGLNQGPAAEVGKVPELAGYQPMPGGPELPVQNIETDLAFLRSQMPFLPIVSFPKTIRTLFLPTAGTAVDLNIPTGVVLARFAGNGNYFVSRSKAVLPSATTDDGLEQLYKPEWAPFYLGAVRQLSVVADVNNAYVQVCMWSVQDWPSP